MRIILYEPEIPPNTGNIARLCAATDTELHLIEPLGFKLDDAHLRRAGLDYWPHVRLFVWPNFDSLPQNGSRLVMTSSKGGECVQNFAFESNDSLVLGPETRGLPQNILERSPYKVHIPMRRDHVRSLNLSTSAGIVLYMALASCGMPDCMS